MKWINEFFKKDWKNYYRTLELNEKLYFHYKGRHESLLSVNSLLRFWQDNYDGALSASEMLILRRERSKFNGWTLDER